MPNKLTHPPQKKEAGYTGPPMPKPIEVKSPTPPQRLAKRDEDATPVS